MDRYQTNLVWIDLEMTGLDISRDTILEIATIITDNQLNVLAEGPSHVIHHTEETLAIMDAWNQKHHGQSGLINAVRASEMSMIAAEDAALIFIQAYCKKNTAPLCGNSVWQDRIFLRKYMPRLEEYLHYRIIDTSSIKEVVKRWYPESPHANFVKAENHRALEDIVQSIEELKHYRAYFFCEIS